MTPEAQMNSQKGLCILESLTQLALLNLRKDSIFFFYTLTLFLTININSSNRKQPYSLKKKKKTRESKDCNNNGCPVPTNEPPQLPFSCR